jgi:hypothetical protein
VSSVPRIISNVVPGSLRFATSLRADAASPDTHSSHIYPSNDARHMRTIQLGFRDDALAPAANHRLSG